MEPFARTMDAAKKFRIEHPGPGRSERGGRWGFGEGGSAAQAGGGKGPFAERSVERGRLCGIIGERGGCCGGVVEG